MSKRQYNVDSKWKVEDGKLHSVISQDVTDTLKTTAELRNSDGGNLEMGKHVARIPMVLMYQWAWEDTNYTDKFAYMQGKHNKDPALAAKFQKRLADRDNSLLRIWKGNVAVSDIFTESSHLKRS